MKIDNLQHEGKFPCIDGTVKLLPEGSIKGHDETKNGNVNTFAENQKDLLTGIAVNNILFPYAENQIYS